MKFILFFLLLLVFKSQVSFAQETQIKSYIRTDTINTKNGTLIIFIKNPKYDDIKNKFRSSVKVTIKDKKSKKILPLAFVGIRKILFQVGENGSGNFYLQKGTYRISAYNIGYNTLSSSIKINSNYTYEIEIFATPKSDMLY